MWNKYTDNIEAIAYWLYFGVTVWNICIVIGVVVFISIIIHCLNTVGDVVGDGCYAVTEAGVICNATAFAILSLTLLVVVIPLFKALRDL